jgi:RNA polymerase sporulation-specific sigma factor
MQIKERISNEKGYEPTVEEIAKEMNLKKEDVVIALEAVVDPVSFYEPVYSNGGDTIFLMDQIGSNETDVDWVDEIVLKEAIKDLPQREKKILSMRFMRGMTQTEVANEIGISQAQVSRLEKNALDSIKGK